MKPSISVIIVSYNTVDELRDCLVSLQAQSSDYDIIVVDNNSPDESVAMVKQDFPSVQCIANTDNVGFAKANNQGLAIAQGEFVVFLNPDTVVHANALETLIEYLQSNPSIGLVGPHTFNADNKTTQSTALRFPTLKRFFHTHVPIWHLIPGWSPETVGEYFPHQTQEVEVVKGCCMAMRTSLARQIGGMNERYFMYSEEFDLCHAVRLQKLQVWYIREASIMHIDGASTRKVSDEMLIHRLRSLKATFQTFSPNASLILFRIILGIGSIWRYGVWKVISVLSSTKKEIAQKRAHDHSVKLHWLWKDFT
jgi:GT2 family glycosyltransferase